MRLNYVLKARGKKIRDIASASFLLRISKPYRPDNRSSLNAPLHLNKTEWKVLVPDCDISQQRGFSNRTAQCLLQQPQKIKELGIRIRIKGFGVEAETGHTRVPF